MNFVKEPQSPKNDLISLVVFGIGKFTIALIFSGLGYILSVVTM